MDELLVQRGHAPSREQARALVLAGSVAVPGVATPKPGLLVDEQLEVEVSAGQRYVSRGGTKLAHALDRFAVAPEKRVCADLGASTGGFTDCLLQRGAARVYAVDVGYGQLHWSLRNDSRVVVMERTNARYLEHLPEPVDLVTIDASFISLRLLLPAARRVATAAADIVALVKPQFEAGRDRVGRGGVVRDPSVHGAVLVELAQWLTDHEFRLRGLTPSPIRGPAGNIEFLAHVTISADASEVRYGLIDAALDEAGSTAHGE